MDKSYITIDELLTLDSLFPFIKLAGWSGCTNQIAKICTEISLNPAKEAFEDSLVILECEELMPFLQELILTNNPLKIQGIFVLSGNKPFLSPALVSEFDRLKLPVIYFPEIYTSQFIKTIFEWVLHLKKTDSFTLFAKKSNPSWLRIANEDGLQGLIKRLTDRMGNLFLLLDPFFNLLYPASIHLGNLSENEFLSKLKQQFLKHQQHNERKTIFTLKLKNFSPTTIVYPLAVNKKIYAYLFILETEKTLCATDYIVITQSLPALLSESIKHHEITETEKKFQDNFIYDLLHNNIASLKTIVKQGRLWGWDFTKPHQLLIIDLKPFRDETPLFLLKSSITQVIANKFKNPIVVEHDNQFLVMIPENPNDNLQYNQGEIKGLAKEIFSVLKKGFPEIAINIGIGRLYPSALDLCRSYQEAKTALELSRLLNLEKRIAHFDDLGLIRLLASVSYEQLNDFSLEYLDPLISFDEANETNLLKTLEIFLQESGDFNNTAKNLFIHPNTLRHRIKKIEEILKMDLGKYNDLVNLWTAIKIHIMLKDMLN